MDELQKLLGEGFGVQFITQRQPGFIAVVVTKRMGDRVARVESVVAPAHLCEPDDWQGAVLDAFTHARKELNTFAETT